VISTHAHTHTNTHAQNPRLVQLLRLKTPKVEIVKSITQSGRRLRLDLRPKGQDVVLDLDWTLITASNAVVFAC